MIDVSRHRDVFDPAEWGSRRVDVIGVGATGSKVALALAKLGVRNLHVWDGDVVEEHNLANQVYDQSDIGVLKHSAISRHIEAVSGILPMIHGWWKGHKNMGEVVFCLPDSMEVRKKFCDTHRVSMNTKLVIDTRMGASHGQVITYKPNDAESLERYEASLFSDDDAEVEVSACGTAITVGPTADVIVGFAVWQFINYAAGGEVVPELAVGVGVPQLVAV